MESKKIWIINHYALAPSQGGLSRHFYFSKFLAQKGDTVRIFTSSAIHNTDVNMIKPEEKTLFKEAEVDGQIFTYIKSNQYKGNGLGRIKNMLGFAFSLKKIMLLPDTAICVLKTSKSEVSALILPLMSFK